MRYRVAARQEETADTVTLELEPVDTELLRFEPGQFTMLTSFGTGEVPISISGDPDEGSALVHTLREVGPVTKALRAAEVGDLLGVRGPFGNDWGVPEAAGQDLVFVAGGIGLAPLRPAILQALAKRDGFGRITVLIGARTPDDLILRDSVEDWSRRVDVDVAVTVDRAMAGWHGDVGLVTALLGRVAFEAPPNKNGTTAFVCGPEVMMRAVASELVRFGLPSTSIRVSLERNMRCGVGLCGHCQLGPYLICRDGPVFDLAHAAPLLTVREL
ncbi:FAD/NAD(P)-binding protein [Flindersiella endophytica]